MHTPCSFLKPPNREHEGEKMKARNEARQLRREAKEGRKRGVESEWKMEEVERGLEDAT